MYNYYLLSSGTLCYWCNKKIKTCDSANIIFKDIGTAIGEVFVCSGFSLTNSKKLDADIIYGKKLKKSPDKE